MTVTNTIRDEVLFLDDIKDWSLKPLTNEEIIKALSAEQKKGFLSFSWGVWVTAHARNNLLRNIIKCDKYCVYADTDSMKLVKGYPRDIIENYNKFVLEKIEYVSQKLDIPIEKFMPKDKKGKARPLGVFDFDGHYERFITFGAKKYAFEEIINQDEIGKNFKEVKKIDDKKSLCLGITVAGVPKQGVKEMNFLEDFQDDLVFNFENTNKNILFYVEHQEPFLLKDYQGKVDLVKDISGCCLLPCTYRLSRSYDYVQLLDEASSNRAKFIEN